LNQRPQGVASLCPGLSPYAPLGLGDDDPNRAGDFPGLLLFPGFMFGGAARLNRCVAHSHSPRLAPSGSQGQSPVSQPAPAVGPWLD
jgi:hypothetical protein